MDRQCLGGTCFSRSSKSCFASIVRDPRCLSRCDGSGCSWVATSIFGTSEVIVTIMMNYILLYVSTFALHEVMPESYRSSLDSSNMISQNASLRLPWLTQAFGGSRVNSGLFLAIIALIFVWLLMKKTTLGFEVRSVGLNPFASEYAGMSSKRTIVLSMVISGALAGLGGVVEGLGTYQNFFVQTTSLSIDLTEWLSPYLDLDQQSVFFYQRFCSVF